MLLDLHARMDEEGNEAKERLTVTLIGRGEKTVALEFANLKSRRPGTSGQTIAET